MDLPISGRDVHIKTNLFGGPGSGNELGWFVLCADG